MSGGVGPPSDIRLPKEEPEQSGDEATAGNRSFQSSSAAPALRPRFLTFRQLNALAITIVFAASGLVAAEDFAFVVFSLLYIHFLAKVAFPCAASPAPAVFDRRKKLFRLYMLFSAVVGLLLPIAYVLGGIFEGDKEGIKAAAPHVFLLASQVFMEGVAASERFSLPIRVFVPVFFNSRRIFALAEWLRAEIGKAEGQQGGSARRVAVGRALAVANMALWCFNLFGFLLPVYLPRAFKKYYSAVEDDNNKRKN